MSKKDIYLYKNPFSLPFLFPPTAPRLQEDYIHLQPAISGVNHICDEIGLLDFPRSG